MPEKEFVVRLTSDDIIRHHRFIVGGQVGWFVVQYEARIEGKWVAIVRYDTAHGFAHRDLIHPSGKIIKSKLRWQDFNEAYTYAQQDLGARWEFYRAQYEWEKRRLDNES